MLRHLSLNLENRLVDVACTDARLVSILRCEERKLAWLASNVGRCHSSRILGDVFCLIVLGIRQILQRKPTIGFLIVQRNLNIEHLLMCLKRSLLRGLTMGCCDVHKQVITTDEMLTIFKLIKVVLFQELRYLCEERIKRNILLQIV